MTDWGLRSATELASAVRAREMSALELVDHVLTRVGALNPELNAIVTIDAERARAEARRLDDALLTDGPVGALHGLPITVKDTLETAGMRTTAGTERLADHIPDVDSDVVALVKQQGAIVFGKTNVPPFAEDHQTYNSLFGTTNNPWGTSLTPGGSSGGAAAAVSTGMTAFEIGSDIGNSIRSPASHCGVFGHKPTFGLVSMRGHIPPMPGGLQARDIEVVGPLARAAEDIELLLPILASRSPDNFSAPRSGSLEGYRIAAWFDDPDHPTAPETRDVLERAVDELRRAGAKIDDAARPAFSMREARAVFNALIVGALSPNLSEEETAFAEIHRDDPGPAGRFARNVSMTHREWLAYDERRQQLRARWDEFFRDFDALLCPCNPVPPFEHDQPAKVDMERTVQIGGHAFRYFDQSVWAGLGGVAYLPGTAAPIGRTPEGLPVGMQIVGPYGEDMTCIDLARRITEIVGGYEPPPMAIL